MKALEWQRLLQDYRQRYGKVVFTPTELANITALSLPVLKTSVRRLCSAGVLQRYTPGRYGLPGAAKVEDLVWSVDSGAYITGIHALYQHNLITQAPQQIHAFTNRRHNRSRVRRTSLGTLIFVSVQRPVYARPDDALIAGQEQALCDYIYTVRRQGLSADSLVTFRKLETLDRGKLEEHLARYPTTVAKDVRRLFRP